MSKIETGIYVPSEENPNKLEYLEQRTGTDIFNELKYRLEAVGYLPDESFEINKEFLDGRKFPQDSEVYCSVQCGGKTSIHLGLSLAYADENGKEIKVPFATGKSSDTTNSALDRMYLTACAITKAFYTDEQQQQTKATSKQDVNISTSANEETPDLSQGRIIHLNEEEAHIVADSLLSTRQKWKEEKREVGVIEQILRRVVGSIRLLNLFANPNFAHMEDGEFEPAIPVIR